MFANINFVSPILKSDQASWLIVFATLLSAFVLPRVFKFVHALKAVDFLPGLRIPFEPLSTLGAALPETWWNPVYDRYGCDTVSILPFISGSPAIYTRSLQVGKQIVVAGHGSGAFGKPDYLHRVLLLWGRGIVAAEGEVWRKHRKIVSPTFNNETYGFVWDTSYKLYEEMISVEGWATKDVVEVPSVQELTIKAGFPNGLLGGSPFIHSYVHSSTVCADYHCIGWLRASIHMGQSACSPRRDVHTGMRIITQTTTFAIAAPPWAWKLPLPWFRRTRRAYDTMRAFMYALVSTTRETIRSGHEDATTKRAKDLFSLLIRASEDAGGKTGLSDNELIGNVFGFLLAGHESTAHTLAATLAFLALEPDLQDELVAQVQEVTRERGDNTLLVADYGKLDKILAAFHEGIRMLPSGVFLVREAKRDTVLDISDGDEPRMLSVKEGTHIVVDMIGIQYHPRSFSEPDEFRPSRWYRRQQELGDDAELEEYTAFSIGPRACLGRKFATMEGVCFLASLLREWRIEPLLATKLDGAVETVDEWRGRVI